MFIMYEYNIFDLFLYKLALYFYTKSDRFRLAHIKRYTLYQSVQWTSTNYVIEYNRDIQTKQLS